MVRTQVYLTNRQREALDSLCRTMDKKQSELIREAIDCLIAQKSTEQRHALLQQAAGMWKDRSDLDFDAVRKAWDRSS